MKYLHTLDRAPLNELIDRENEVLEGEPEPVKKPSDGNID